MLRNAEEQNMSNLVTLTVENIYKMDNDQLNQVVEAIKLKRNHIAKQMARSVIVGDIVSFVGRGNQLVQGKVLKVNPKTLVVQDTQTQARWKVTASLVTPMTVGA
tara:strand:- start:171 stop:485 length:315 start_codon:yes stop_codon:yes gene_type:complete